MAGGPIFPTGDPGTSGNITDGLYTPATNTNSAGQMPMWIAAASMPADSDLVLQFNLPESIPSGTAKLRMLARANATSGTAKVTVADGVTAAGSNPGATTLTSETQVSQTWTTADVLVENKVTLSATPVANSILTCKVTFNNSGYTLAVASGWQFTLIWE